MNCWERLSRGLRKEERKPRCVKNFESCPSLGAWVERCDRSSQLGDFKTHRVLSPRPRESSLSTSMGLGKASRRRLHVNEGAGLGQGLLAKVAWAGGMHRSCGVAECIGGWEEVEFGGLSRKRAGPLWPCLGLILTWAPGPLLELGRAVEKRHREKQIAPKCSSL